MKEIIAYEMQYNYNQYPIIIHVAKWNEKAVSIYENNSLIITNMEKVRRYKFKICLLVS